MCARVLVLVFVVVVMEEVAAHAISADQCILKEITDMPVHKKVSE